MQIERRVHDLKCWPDPFEAMYHGMKSFEFRKDDRGYEAGHVLLLREWDPLAGGGGAFTGRTLRQIVTYLLRGPEFGVPAGYVVMSVKPEPPVHIVRHGFAFCGRIGVPREWPEGEKWVDVTLTEVATCQGCLAVLREAGGPDAFQAAGR